MNMFDSAWEGRTEDVIHEKCGLITQSLALSVLSARNQSNFFMASLLPLCHRPVNVYTPQPVTGGDGCWGRMLRSTACAKRPGGSAGPCDGLAMCDPAPSIKTRHLHLALSSPCSSSSGLRAAVRAQLQRQMSRW